MCIRDSRRPSGPPWCTVQTAPRASPPPTGGRAGWHRYQTCHVGVGGDHDRGASRGRAGAPDNRQPWPPARPTATREGR
eukprot:1117102-Alexandrium_andersonii.AAC.1